MVKVAGDTSTAMAVIRDEASKRRPRAAEVMARSHHVLRVLEVRC